LNLYAESSAVLAWLLGEEQGGLVARSLESADNVLASDLTLVECERVLIRAWSGGLISEATAAAQRSALARVAAHWVLLRVDSTVVERCRRPFPIEPVRTLDALHLSSALAARGAVPDLSLLTLDQRIRENGERLGLPTVP